MGMMAVTSLHCLVFGINVILMLQFSVIENFTDGEGEGDGENDSGKFTLSGVLC